MMLSAHFKFQIKIWLILITNIAFVPKALAQYNLLDSIQLSLKEKPQFYIGFHNRNTLINVQKTKLYGIIAGFDFDNKLKLYGGIYGFGREEKRLLSQNNFPNHDSVYRSITSENVSIGIDYTCYHKDNIYISIPFQIGIGKTTYKFFENNTKNTIQKNNYTTFPLELGSNVFWEFLPFIGIKAGIGYRFSIGKKEVTRLTSPYYNIGVAIRLGEGYRFIKAMGKTTAI